MAPCAPISGLEGRTGIPHNERVPMKSLALTLFSILLSASASPAAVKIGKDWDGSNSVLPFFRNPESRFRSGEIHRRDLEKKWISDRFNFSYLIQTGPKQHWIPADSLARDLQLSEFVHSEKNQMNYRIIKTEGSQILGESVNQKSQVWLPLQELTPVPEDLGVAMTLTTTLLRKAPSWRSEGLVSLPPKTRVRLIKMEEDFQATWALVEFESIGKIQGWIDLNNILTKFDFAAFAMTKDKKWIPISYRQGSELVTAQQKKIPLKQIVAIMTKPDLGVSLVTDEAHGLLLRQNISILKVDAQTWSLSRLPGHGEVYWKKNADGVTLPLHSKSPQPAVSGNDQTLTTEQLLKRELNSVSFHPLNPNIGMASSQGIYLTLDGKIWTRIRQFKTQSHAVLVDRQSVFYVGSLRSFDLGKTFNPFLRLESLSRLIEQKQRQQPNQMRISALSIPTSGILQMEVETELGRLKLAARNSVETLTKWDFL